MILLRAMTTEADLGGVLAGPGAADPGVLIRTSRYFTTAHASTARSPTPRQATYQCRLISTGLSPVYRSRYVDLVPGT